MFFWSRPTYLARGSHSILPTDYRNIGNWSHRATSTMVTEDDQTNFSEDDEEEMSSAFGEPSEKEEDERDEVKEVHKLAQKETARVRMGKLLVLVSILATAALVSTGTYIFLKKEEDADYNKSVSIPFISAQRTETP
jgi:hypothetical protein